MIIDLDYTINSYPRYGHGKPPHKILYEIINRNRDIYKNNLITFLKFKDNFVNIHKERSNRIDILPTWINGFIPGLDAIALYSFLCIYNPLRYIEIGSGNSTKFARKAIQDHNLRTEIISIDPNPRSEINSICDKIIRKPIEEIDIAIFDELDTGDILFVDNSHRIFMNSDAVTVFLDILPNIRQGVLIEFHDIYLPFDYPVKWINRYYSEQYMLAAYLLAESKKLDIILPNAFISSDPELNSVLSSIWKDPRMNGVETHGGSFWIKIQHQK